MRRMILAVLLMTPAVFGQTVNPPAGGSTLPSNLPLVGTDGTGNAIAATPAKVELLSVDTSTCLYQLQFNEGTGSPATSCGALANSTLTGGAAWLGKFVNINADSQYIGLPNITGMKTITFGMLFPMYKNTGGYGNFPNYGDFASFPGNPCFFCNSTGTAYAFLSYSNVSNATWSTSRVANVMTSYSTSVGLASTTFVAPGWHTVTFRCGQVADSTFDEWYVDGQPRPMIIQFRSCANGFTGTYQLGGSSPLNAWWRGLFGFFQADSGAVDPVQIATNATAINNFLMSKGASNLPQSGAVTTGAIVCLGDSRTNGYNSGNTTCGYISGDGALPGVPNVAGSYWNFGINGSRAVDHCAQFDYWGAYQLGDHSLMNVWFGVNEATGGAYTTAEDGFMQCIVRKAKAKGAKVVVMTEISGSSSPGSCNEDTQLQAWTASIRANAVNLWGADNVGDQAETPLGITNGCLNTTYFNTDNLHPKAAGTSLLSQLQWNVDAETLGSSEAVPTQFAPSSGTPTYSELAIDGWLVMNNTSTANGTVTLPSCVGYSRARHFQNISTSFTLTVEPNGTETINGSNASIGPYNLGGGVILTPIPGIASAGGCSWRASTTNSNAIKATVTLANGASTSSTMTFPAGFYISGSTTCQLQPQNITPTNSQALSGYTPQVGSGGVNITVGTANATGSTITFSGTCTP